MSLGGKDSTLLTSGNEISIQETLPVSCRVEWHSSHDCSHTITGCLETIVIIITGKAAGKKFQKSLSDGGFE